MSAAGKKLFSEFETLADHEKQEFLQKVIHHLPPWDAGPLSEEVVAAAGDQMAALLEDEERASYNSTHP